MKNLKWFTLIEALFLCWVVTVLADNPDQANMPPVPTPGLVTMVDLGAHKCIPCKMDKIKMEKKFGNCQCAVKNPNVGNTRM